ncbi:MAG: ATP phosphoribosyltransferase [Dehalococcoidia bacterium]|nr:MAG: ATP phosphoribosyltransferase [Dehalococcoidia bacterium]
MAFRIALPKGRLLKETSALLEKSGWKIEGYNTQMRHYRLLSKKYPEMGIKVFQEKDIPIQVAVGNYDIGICGLNWIEELLVKYPSSAIDKILDLGYGEGALFAAMRPEMMRGTGTIIRIASEYSNLAESFAERLRLKRFSILPLWGAAEVYPPESAEIVLLTGKTEKDLVKHKLVNLSLLVKTKAYLIANKNSLKKKDMTQILAALTKNVPHGIHEIDEINNIPVIVRAVGINAGKQNANDKVRIALPDGHQQSHVCSIFKQAGIYVHDYPSKTGNRRPVSNIEGILIKVIRPQDMPLQVANDNFDLAITGRDWFTEHKYQFPSSPVVELVDLKYGRVRLVAVISKDMPAENIDEWQRNRHQSHSACRVASEYTNIADNYARDKRLGRYRIIPTWGATEAFLPEDADILIENTETGGTIARHNLKIIDTLFESTVCLIGSKRIIYDKIKQKRVKRIIEALESAVGAN